MYNLKYYHSCRSVLPDARACAAARLAHARILRRPTDTHDDSSVMNLFAISLLVSFVLSSSPPISSTTPNCCMSKSCIVQAMAANCSCSNGIQWTEEDDCRKDSLLEESLSSAGEEDFDEWKQRRKRAAPPTTVETTAKQQEQCSCSCHDWKVATIVLGTPFAIVIVINTLCCLSAHMLAARADAIYGGSHRLCR